MMGSIGMTTGLVGYCLYLVSTVDGEGLAVVCSVQQQCVASELLASHLDMLLCTFLLMSVCVRACCLLCLYIS